MGRHHRRSTKQGQETTTTKTLSSSSSSDVSSSSPAGPVVPIVASNVNVGTPYSGSSSASSSSSRSGSDRLPSFRGMRDLTLSSSPQSSLSLASAGRVRGSSSPPPPSPGWNRNPSPIARSPVRSAPPTPLPPPPPPLVSRPKKVFKPNIPPPRRDRGVGEGPSTAVGTTSGTPPPSSASRGLLGDRRGGGPPPRGRGGGRGRGQSNLVQSSSVFAEGVGDPLSTRASSRPSFRGGGGGTSSSRSRFSTAAGPPMSREKLQDIIKTEVKQEVSIANVFEVEDPDGGENEEEFVIPLEDEPVMLPLSDYMISSPEVRIKTKKEKSNVPQPHSSLQEEPSDDDEDDSTTTFKPHDGGGATLLHLIRQSHDSKPTLVLFQLPSHLPILLEQETNKSELTTSLDTLPEGRIGKMQVLADGSCRFLLENSLTGETNMFNVENGKSLGFRQDLLAIDLEKEKVVELGDVQRKFVLTPDIDSLIDFR